MTILVNYITKLKLWVLYLSITVKTFRNENLIIQISCLFIEKFCIQNQHVYRKTGIIICDSSVLDLKCFMPLQTTFEYGRVIQTTDLKICFCTLSTGIPWYSQQLLGGLSPHWVRWGQEALAVLCLLQDPEVLVGQEVLKVLQILYHPENIRMLVYVTTRVFHMMSSEMHFTVPYLRAFRAWCPWLALWPWIPWPTCITMWAFDSRHTRYSRWSHWSWMALWTKFKILVAICYKGFTIIYCGSIMLLNIHDVHKHVLNRNFISS